MLSHIAKSAITCSAFAFFFAGCVQVVSSAQETPEQLALHQKRAQQAEARGDFATAVREYKQLVQAVPKSAELQSNLGVALYFHHDFVPAANAFQRAIALNGQLYAPHLFLGLARAQLSQTDSAIAELEKAVAIDGADPLGRAWLGYEYFAQSSFEKAAEQLEKASQLKPEDQDVWFALGHCYLEMGKSETERLIELDPDGGRAWQLAAEQFDSQGKADKASKYYAMAYQRRPDIPALSERIIALGGALPEAKPPSSANHQREDEAYARVHEYEKKAQASFAQIARIDPDSYRAHQVLGDGYAAANRYEDAIKEYGIVLDKKPDLPEVHADLCEVYSQIGKPQEAIKQCEGEIAVSPFSANAYVQAARVYQLVDNDERAVNLLQKALALNRPPALTYKLLGRAYLSQKKYQAAVDVLTKYTAAEKQDAGAYFSLARAYKGLGSTAKMNSAVAEYRRLASSAKGASETKRALIQNDVLAAKEDEKSEGTL